MNETTHVKVTRRAQVIDTDILGRVQQYAKAYRLDVDAVIEAAVSMAVPEKVGGTAGFVEIEMDIRAQGITARNLRSSGK